MVKGQAAKREQSTTLPIMISGVGDENRGRAEAATMGKNALTNVSARIIKPDAARSIRSGAYRIHQLRPTAYCYCVVAANVQRDLHGYARNRLPCSINEFDDKR